MNDHHDGSELPDLTDDDVRLLYNICQRADGSADPPFKALFSAYDAILKEEETEQEHDGVIFRALLRVGESTAQANKKRQHVDLVERLENVLEARGITLIRDDGQDELTGTSTRADRHKKPSRRVSFDDARLEETWLSEHSEAVNLPSPPAQPLHRLLSLPPRRARRADSGRRARSTSSRRSVLRHAAPKLRQTSSSHDHFSEDGEPQNPTLHFEVSQTQLETNADAMLGISEVRLQRRTLHFLHDQSLQLQAAHKQSSAIAIAHDRRILLKQALETWRGALQEHRHERRYEQHFRHLERKAERARDLFLITKAFTHWATQCSDERFRTRIAQHYVLRAKYFKRWRTIAIENQTKIRRILCRKYISIWREKTARCSLSEEYAHAWYEEHLMRRCKLGMFWEFCRRQVTDNHDVWIKRRALSRLRGILQQRQEAEARADHEYEAGIARHKVHLLGTLFLRRRQNNATAARNFDHTLCSKAFGTLGVQAKLAPLVKAFTQRQGQMLLRSTLQTWHHKLELEHHAEMIRCRMLLLNAITIFNDRCRCKRLQERIDERMRLETLYRLSLQMRFRKHLRFMDGKLLLRVFSTWHAKASEERNQIEYAQAVFAEAQHRRRQRAGFVAMNLIKRKRDDARRAAVEFRNVRDLPPVFDRLRQHHEHVQRLESWAQMAIFYRLGTKVLRTWSERTTEHRANRRRDAYAHVRGRIKIRVVRSCFARWHSGAMELRAVDAEAERRAAGRLEGAKVGALIKWRDKTATIVQFEGWASAVDQEKLLRSALGALLAQSSEKASLQQRLEQSNRATELAILASALRRLLWESFKAARNRESAEALRLRNRDLHTKKMLRHWAAKTAARRLPPPDPGQKGDPESPSLRPASRAASRASAATTPATLLPSSPPQPSGLADSTPGYMRTPSRSRRTGRFRPLPTPAGVTPFAFDSAYLATTPAPLPPLTGIAGGDAGMEGLTPQVTPFERKLRAGGFGSAAPVPPSALRSSVFGVAPGGTGKSVRFAGSGGRFGVGRLKGS